MNLRTKLDLWCDGVIEAGWLAALVVAPMFFNVFSSRVFEPDKISMVRTIALVMALAWLVKIANGGYSWLPVWSATPPAEPESQGVAARRMWRNPFFIPVALLIFAYLISTLFSLAPFVSWFGSYQRLQGTYSVLSYLTIALITAGHLRSPAQIRRLQHVVVLTSVPIAIYGIIQHQGSDPLPWGGDTTRRITANEGNSIFLGAYLIMALFMTLERAWSSVLALVKSDDTAPRGFDLITSLAGGVYLVTLMIQVLAIVWTQSRGVWIGGLFGIYLFGLLVLVALRPRGFRVLRPLWVAAGILGLSGVIALNAVSGMESVRTIPYLGRLSQLLDFGSTTAQVRLYIWEGSAEMMTPHAALVKPDGTTDRLNMIRPLVGYGPEAMWVAFNKFYPPKLAQVEARNASPDRSHNETWDSLVVTGILGFVAYMSLFLSIFYWSLRWLGLIQGKRDTALFFSIVGGATLFFIAVAITLDGGQLRLLGVALPAGIMFGILFYVMTASFLHTDYRPDRADAPRQLLIIAILTTVLAHFAEIHFGIAIASSRTYFWIFTAMLLAVGLRWATVQPISVTLEEESPTPENEPVQAASKRSKSATRPVARRPLRSMESLPFAPLTVVTDALVFLTAVLLYTTNGRGQTNPFTILLDSITTITRGGEVITKPSILWLLLFTWLFAIIIGLSSEVLRRRQMPSGTWWVKAVLSHAAIVGGVWLVYGLVQAGRLAPMQIPQTASPTEQLNLQLNHIANHFAYYTVIVLLWILAAGTFFGWPRGADQRLPVARRPLVSLLAGVAGAIIVTMIVAFVNVGLVRADIIYKQGQQFDNQANWASSIELYRRALAARETEDHYMLFLGRSLLEQAKTITVLEGTTEFPATPALSDVLALRPETIPGLGRLDLLRAAEAVLLQAQRINPLNTDHTANLARLYRSWADMSGEDADMRKAMLDNSITQYNTATTLSPNAAHLWNEKGNAHLVRGERAEAEAAYLHSLSLDELYEQTYLLLSDFYEGSQQFDQAADLLRKGVAAIEPVRGKAGTLQLNSFLGVALSRTGDVTGAIEAMQDVIEAQPTNLTAMRNLALLYRDAGDLPTAARWIDQAIQMTPVEQTNELAQTRLAALEIYQALASADPADYRYPLAIAQLLQAQSDNAGARQFATQALSLAPQAERPTVEQFLAGLPQ